MIRILNSRSMDVTGVTRGNTRSLRTRFLVAMLVGQAAACLVILLPMFKGRDQLILSELQRARTGRLSVLITSFREDLDRDPVLAMARVLEALSRQPDVLYAAFVVPGRSVAGRLPQDRSTLYEDPDLFLAPDSRWVEDQLEISVPVSRSHSSPVALVSAFDTAPIIDHMDELMLSGVGLGLGALTLGCCLTLVMSRQVIGSLEAFARFAREVAAGNPPPAPLVDPVYELDLLAQTLNAMSEEVDSSRQVLRRYNEDLEEKVAEKARELRAAHASLLAADRLATTGRMAAEVAHEVRNPLGTIALELDVFEEFLQSVGSGEATHDSGSLQDAAKGLRAAKSALDRIQSLVSSYLSFEKSEDSRLVLLEANQLLKFAEEAFLELPCADPPRLTMFSERDLPAVEVDPLRLKMAVKSLFKNSLDAFDRCGAGPDRQLQVSLRVRNSGLSLEIEDNAGGIDPRIGPRATEPFVSTLPNRSGLGLPLALRIARDLGGDLRIESETGKGTRACILLPASTCHQGEDLDGNR